MLNIQIKTDSAKRATNELTSSLERLSSQARDLATSLEILKRSLATVSDSFAGAAAGARTYSSRVSEMAARVEKTRSAVRRQAEASRDAARAATEAAAATKAATAATAAHTKALVVRQAAYKSQATALLEMTKALQTTTGQTKALAVQGSRALVAYDSGLRGMTESQERLAVSQRKGFEVFRSWKESLASASPYLTETDRVLLSLGQNAERVFGPAFKKAASNYNELSESYRKGLDIARVRMGAMEGEKKLLLGLGEGYRQISQSYAKGLAIYADKVRSTMATTATATKAADETYGRMATTLGQTTSAYQRFMETYALGTRAQRSATEAAARATKGYKALFDTYRMGEPWFERIGKHQEFMNKVLGSGTSALQKYQPALNQATAAHLALGKSYQKGAVYGKSFSAAQIMMNKGVGQFVEAANDAIGVGLKWRNTAAQMISRQQEITKQYKSMAAASKKSILEEEGLVGTINEHIAVSKRHTKELQNFADRTAEAEVRTRGFRGWINKLKDSFTFSNARIFEGQKTLMGFTKETDNFGRAAKRGTSILNTWIGRFSVYMSGVAATIFVLQNLIHVIDRFISMAAEFEKAIGKLEIKRATDEWAALADQILKTADAVGKKGAETAEALNLMAEAGFGLKESLSEIEGPIKQLSIILGVDLGSAVDIVTGILNTFKMDLSKTSEVVRDVGGIVMKTKISFKTLSEQIREVMPDAKRLGYSFDQVATILGSLARGNIMVKKTGDELRIAMIKAAKFADQYNLANKNLVSVMDILKEKGLSAAEIIELFGEKQSEVISYIYEHIDALKQLNPQIRASGREWEEMVALMSKKVGPSWDRLKASVATVLEAWVSKYGPEMAKSMRDMAKWVVENRDNIVEFMVAMGKFAKVAATVAALFIGQKGLSWLFAKFGGAMVDVNRTAAAMTLTLGLGGRKGLIGSIGRLAVKMGVLRGAVLALKLALSPLAKILLIMAAFDVGKWLYRQRQSWKTFVDDFTTMNDKIHELQERMVTDQRRLYEEFAGGKHREFIDSIEESTVKFSAMIGELEKMVTLKPIKGPGYGLLHPSGLAGEVASKMNLNMKEMNELLEAVRASFEGLGRAAGPAIKELEKFADPVMKMRLEEIGKALHEGLDLTKEQLTILFVASLRKDVEAMKSFSQEASNWMDTVDKMLQKTRGKKLDLITVEDRDKMADILTGDALKMYETFYKKVSYMSDKYYKHLRAKARAEYIHDAITREKIAEKGQEELIAAEMVYTQKLVKIEEDRTKARVNWMKMTQRALPDIEKQMLLEEAEGVNRVVRLYEDGYKEMGYHAEEFVDSLEKQLVRRYTSIFEKHLKGLQDKYKYYYKKFRSYPKKFYDDARDQLKAFAAKADEAFSGASDKVTQYVKGLIKLLERQDKVNAEQTIYRDSLLKGAATIEKWKDGLEGAIKTLKQWKLWTARAKEEVKKQRLEIASFTAYMKSGGFLDGFVSGFLKIASQWDTVTTEIVKTGYEAAKDLYDGMRKFFFDAMKGRIKSFQDVWKRMTDYMLDTFLSLLAKIMARAAMTKIVIPIMLSVGMGGNALAAALKSAGLGDFSSTFGSSMVSGMASGGGSGILGLIGKVGSGIGKLITGSLSTSWAGLQHTIAGFISPDWANAFSSGFASKIAGFIGTAPGWLMGIGSGIGAALIQGISTGNWAGAAVTGALTAIGGSVLGPVGALIGSLVGSLVSKFFGSGHQDWKAKWVYAIESTGFFDRITLPTATLEGAVPADLIPQLQKGVGEVQKAWWDRITVLTQALGEDTMKQVVDILKGAEINFGGPNWLIREGHPEDIKAILDNISNQMRTALENAIWGTGRQFTGTGWIDIPVPEEPLIDKVRDWFHEGIAFSKLDPAKLKELTDEFEAIDVGDVDALVTWFSKADEVAKSYDQITAAIDKMLGTENQFEIQFKNLNDTFDGFVKTLQDLGFAQEEIDKIEKKRLKAASLLAKTLMQEVDATIEAHRSGSEFTSSINKIREWRDNYIKSIRDARDEMEKLGIDVDGMIKRVGTAFRYMLEDIISAATDDSGALKDIFSKAAGVAGLKVPGERTAIEKINSGINEIFDTFIDNIVESRKEGRLTWPEFLKLRRELASLRREAKLLAKENLAAKLKKEFLGEAEDIIAKHTKSPFEYEKEKLIKWRDDTINAINDARKELTAAGLDIGEMIKKVREAFGYLLSDLIKEMTTQPKETEPSGFTVAGIRKKGATLAGYRTIPGSAVEEAKAQIEEFYATLSDNVDAMKAAGEISKEEAKNLHEWLDMMELLAENEALMAIKEKISDILFAAKESAGVLTEWDTQYVEITQSFRDWKNQLEELGATTEEITELDELRDKALKRLKETLQDEIKGIMYSAREAAGEFSEYEKAQHDIEENFKAWKKRLEELGATTDELNRLDALRIEALENLKAETVAEIEKSYDDIILKSKLSDIEYERYQLAVWYAEEQEKLNELLKDGAISTAELARLMEKLKEVSEIKSKEIEDKYKPTWEIDPYEEQRRMREEREKELEERRKQIEAITSAWEEFRRSVVTSSELAPAVSAETVTAEYQRLLSKAQAEKSQEAYDALLSYTKETYLPFMKTYAGSQEQYRTIFDRTMSQLEELTQSLTSSADQQRNLMNDFWGEDSPIYRLWKDWMKNADRNGGYFSGSFQGGTRFVPWSGLYRLHQGEMVVPKDYNPWAGSKAANSGGPTERGQEITINVELNVDGRTISRSVAKAGKDDREFRKLIGEIIKSAKITYGG